MLCSAPLHVASDWILLMHVYILAHFVCLSARARCARAAVAGAAQPLGLAQLGPAQPGAQVLQQFAYMVATCLHAWLHVHALAGPQ